MSHDAIVQFQAALAAGRKYYKEAVAHGKYPYPLILDDILQESAVAGYADLGVINVPAELFVGTRSAGRTPALAGNFMPLMGTDTEFGAKWISLCAAHLGPEGIREPITCYEYLGRFYVEEGNKRLSVLRSFRAPVISARVTRVIPRYTEDPEIQLYYEFMHFYSLSGLYGLSFHHRGDYARLQAALGFEADHVWTTAERRSFTAGFQHFRDALSRHRLPEGVSDAEVLLTWLHVYRFQEIKDLPLTELSKRIANLLPDVSASAGASTIELSTEPPAEGKTVLSRLRGIVRPEHLNVAFLFTASPSESLWARAHDEGRQALEKALSSRVTVRSFRTDGRDYEALVEDAVQAGADVVFATSAVMVNACRKAAALHPNVRFLSCALFQPLTGVRMYNGRSYECKFVTGAIAAAMADGNRIGYVANNPIFGTPASVNAFALGARMVNPHVRVQLEWSCLPGDPVRKLVEAGVPVISNRETASAETVDRYFELGTFRLQPDGTLRPLAVPFWNWGSLYEKIVLSILNGSWGDISSSRAISYWWGMASGLLDIHMDSRLPDGVRSLGEILTAGIRSGAVDPFRSRIVDQSGVLRNDGAHGFTPEEIIAMNWFCDNVDGCLPSVEDLLPDHLEAVRVLGLEREKLLPEVEGGQL
ncbi:MAG: BMP family ABC transporter substrate-binding protein [Oscillospiraceae bacterium]|nr:BMP family ABC transporter substrate-binding protein [Oscillospiraceae bacterium]